MPVKVSDEKEYPVIERDIDESPWSDLYGAPFYFCDDTKARWRKLVKEMIADSEHTPDTPTLSLQERHLVFVYGSLKKNNENHQMLDGSLFLGRAWTKLKSFVMIHNHFPAVLMETGPDKKAIEGELYEVDIPTLKDLDCLEANGVLYKRRRVHVETDLGKSFHCWMYFGIAGVFSKEASPKCNSFVRNKTGVAYYSYQPRLKKAA